MPVLDTLSIYERLKKANLPDEAAREIAEVLNDAVEQRLFTKEYFDLKLKELESKMLEIKAELEGKIKETEARLIKWVVGVVLSVATVQTAIMALLMKLK
ncbi:conserved hypothetical protein [Thermosulfidibacter takaii ABI70S6]|uniref:DUF1640 domain-containing protein n=1 Tax=Thermosulfidibacter takaii (strain DSM 17441 / JCM 13301 / NBRC 103674 / ABI70S6) TaxID=1298851 RepID=A0A0S3QUR2_THET7|nr:hypothetical protein [Thermosulfidibacter takaii]BAT72077.1 conserved hypothetical protein [Thermosulfidibacter takaii ABI70S6]